MACRTCLVRTNRKRRRLSQPHLDKLSELTKQINDVHNELEIAREVHDTELKSLNEVKTKVKKKIAHFKADVIQLIDDIEKATLENMEQSIIQYESEIEQKFKQNENDLKIQKEAIDKLKTNRQFEEVKFVKMRNILSQAEEFIDKIKNGVIDIEFRPTEKLLELKSELNSLGSTHTDLKRNPLKPYILKSTEDISLKSNKDNTTCSITGICSLPNGDVMLADATNKKLTRLSHDSYTAKESLRFLGNPWDVCVTSVHEIAVTFPEETRNVRFIGTTQRLKRLRSLKLRHTCRGIDCFEEKLFVTDQGIFIYVYTIDGTLLTKFSRDTTHRILSDHRTISVSKHLIVLTDWDNGIMAFDRQGNQVWKHNDIITKRASGICFDGDENIFVCSSQSINVVQIDKHGQVIGEIAGPSNGLVYPTSLCFDKERSVILIGQQEAKCIKLKVA